MILGLEQVRAIALGIIIFEHMRNGEQAAQLKDAACTSFNELNAKFPTAPAHVKSTATAERQRAGDHHLFQVVLLQVDHAGALVAGVGHQVEAIHLLLAEEGAPDVPAHALVAQRVTHAQAVEHFKRAFGVPEPKAQDNFTDPDSRIMKTSAGFEQCFNAQTAVDAGAQIIVAAELSNCAADSALLPVRGGAVPAGTEPLVARGAVLDGLSLAGVDFGPLRVLDTQGFATLLDKGETPLIVRGRSGAHELAIWAFDPSAGNLATRTSLLEGYRTLLKELQAQFAPLAKALTENEQKIVDAIQAGALSYLLKDADADSLADAVRRTARGESVLHPRIAARLLRTVRQPDAKEDPAAAALERPGRLESLPPEPIV